MEQAVGSISLSILVFGPQVDIPGEDEKTIHLQDKRKEIKESLLQDGHVVHFAEDVVDPELPEPNNNIFLQEVVIMQEYDLIV